MQKHIKIYALMLIVLLCVNAAVYRHLDKRSDESYNNLKSLYQQKNVSAFLYLIKHASSSIPLAETLETISQTKENEDPVKVRALIEKAKIQAEELDEQLLTFIEFSDDYSNNAEPRLSINQTVMTSDIQEDMFELAFMARTWRPLYNISYAYWKSNPKMIDARTRETLRLLATELRDLDKTISLYKENASFITPLDYATHTKPRLLEQLKPHLEKLKIIQDDFVEINSP
ncbi:hypothetical protein [Paenibacillus sp. LHD-38]|uniref:hypothetical protein n=1 Tax=Paenibacillus sp. LHD-38 TaxID=3072143 RepID=UPI00280F2C84|nr:hypothetical protein [Paenibacillus sp. LHD-38]MDQ8739388.1 hypothetical protein [Paenibacillus sp. LHD-38]